MQLLNLRSKDHIVLQNWLGRTNFKWLSPEIQNEILELMSRTVLKKLLMKVKTTHYFGIMVDESRDISGEKQVFICLRFCNEFIDNFDAEEIFLGFYSTVVHF